MTESVLVVKSKAFALRIVRLYQYLRDKKESVMSKQVLRSGTSIGANVAEGKFAFAVRKLAEVIDAMCASSGVAPESLDLVFAHQANFLILDAVALGDGMRLALAGFGSGLTWAGQLMTWPCL